MKFVFEEFHRNTPDEAFITDLTRVAAKLNKKTVTIDEYNLHGTYHASTLIRRFGSWFRCLEMAGLQPSRSKIGITDEELFENLETIWRELGRQPRYSEVRKPFSLYSVGTYEKRFGTFGNALKAFVSTMQDESNIDEGVEYQKPVSYNPRSVNYRTRFLIMQRDGFKCRLCGSSPVTDPGVKLHIDHIVPCAKGGRADFDNLQTLCSKCNLGKSDLDL